MKQGLIDIKSQSHDRKRKSHKNNPLTCNLFSWKEREGKHLSGAAMRILMESKPIKGSTCVLVQWMDHLYLLYIEFLINNRNINTIKQGGGYMDENVKKKCEICFVGWLVDYSDQPETINLLVNLSP